MQSKALLASISILFVIFVYGIGFHRGQKAATLEYALQKAEYALEQTALIDEAQKENERLKSTLKGVYDENTKILADLHKSKPTGGLRLPKNCPSTSDSKADSTGNEAIAGSGVFPEKTEAAFGRFTTGLDELTLEADLILEDCRKLKQWADLL